MRQEPNSLMYLYGQDEQAQFATRFQQSFWNQYARPDSHARTNAADDSGDFTTEVIVLNRPLSTLFDARLILFELRVSCFLLCPCSVLTAAQSLLQYSTSRTPPPKFRIADCLTLLTSLCRASPLDGRNCGSGMLVASSSLTANRVSIAEYGKFLGILCMYFSF